MADDDMHNELEQLRAEVAALSAARASRKTAEIEADMKPERSQSSEVEDAKGIIENAKSAVAADTELKGEFDQLFDQLEHEIKDLPAITTLAVFSLGVLFGRLLR